MTDEERAEEYAKGKAHEHYHFLFEENNGSPVDFAKLCHLDGLSEGRKLGKEDQWKATEKAQKKTSAKIRALQKEIAELEDVRGHQARIINNDTVRIERLEKENAELKEQNEAIRQEFIEARYRNEGYTKQIEDMQITEYSNLHEQRKRIHKNLIDGFTEQLGIMDKEEDELFSLKEIKSIINFIMELEI